MYLYNYAQISESFKDTSVASSSTTWYGQVNDFKINAEHQLQSIGNINGASTLYTSLQASSAMEWELWVKLNFAPSESNRVRIYIQSNDSIFSNGNAYYIEIGDNGNVDAIKFYRQIKGKSTLLAEGTAGSVANDPVIARIRINRTPPGLWSLSVDYKGGHEYIDEWHITDTFNINETIQYFGIQCIYTSTRKDKFLFDDINIHKDTIDRTPLKILRVEPDINEVRLYLSKPVDSISASDAENFVISNGIGQPRKTRLFQDSIVIITLFKNLTPGNYEIICKTFKDRAGNVTNNLRKTWTYIINAAIAPYELLINEIMIDPTPKVNLPTYEYIEIFNHSNHTIDLGSVSLKFESNKYSFDTASIVLLSGEYIIICESDAYQELKALGKTAKLTKWPALRNSNGTIGIYDSRDSLIHQVIYNDSWYRDIKKKEGGWSIEQINPENVCDQQLNWIASIDATGGTPGKINSVYNSKYPIAFAFDSITMPNDRTINLFPNKSIQLSTTSSFVFSPSLSINNILKQSDPEQITLSLSSPLSSGILYSLKIKLNDCVGRSLETVDVTLAKTEAPALHDLVISEILFNPITGGSDFIELYNRSNKTLSIDQIIVSNELTGKQQIVHNKSLILSGTYWVISPNTEFIVQHYTVPHPMQLISNSLPTFPDDHGQISVWTKDNILIDSCTYDQSYHYDFLNTKDGVTLERIELESPPIINNWHSASGISGYGTPTDKNSNNKFNSTVLTSRFEVKSKTFSPNDDGVEDLLYIIYELSNNDYLARVDIYDDQGRQVRRLVSNLPISNVGSFEWNGVDDQGRLCTSGIYIISINAINITGQSIRERIACVLNR